MGDVRRLSRTLAYTSATGSRALDRVPPLGRGTAASYRPKVRCRDDHVVASPDHPAHRVPPSPSGRRWTPSCSGTNRREGRRGAALCGDDELRRLRDSVCALRRERRRLGEERTEERHLDGAPHARLGQVRSLRTTRRSRHSSSAPPASSEAPRAILPRCHRPKFARRRSPVRSGSPSAATPAWRPTPARPPSRGRSKDTSGISGGERVEGGGVRHRGATGARRR